MTESQDTQQGTTQQGGQVPAGTDGGQLETMPDQGAMEAAGTGVGSAVAAAADAAGNGRQGLVQGIDAAPSFTTELNNIDFKKMIGGPLQAAVDAQVASSLATVNFINSVGFSAPANEGEKRELVMVDFSHKRTDVDADGNPVSKDVNVSVPLLAMLPIPSLRIDQVVIDFNVKLNSVESSSVSDQLGVNAEVTAGWGPVNFKVSASYQRKTTSNVEVKREYALNVNVKAVQDEIPAGLEKILGMLSA